MSRVRIVVVMDPVSTVAVDADTTFALMLEAQRRGHQVEYAQHQDLFTDGGEAWARVRRATCSRETTPPIVLDPPEDVPLADVDVVLMRKDPPFDDDYLHATQILELARGGPLLVNDPRALRDANEKLYALHFPELMPETLVTSHRDRIDAFVERVGGHAVIKPLDGKGGEGIFALRADDSNKNAIVETVTREGRRLAMVQRYLPAVREGDKRILLLDGALLGAILRVPQRGDLRSNIHVGGRVEAAVLDEADHRIVAAVGPRLRAAGLAFVGLDVIGGYLTEVNVTSPTGIQQASRLAGENLEAKVIAWLETSRASR